VGVDSDGMETAAAEVSLSWTGEECSMTSDKKDMDESSVTS